MSKEKEYSIKGLANLMGVSEHTIRKKVYLEEVF
ncbi:hypothetical protein SAMN05446037_10812 [Anaerovirgula multivorans]|uniref:Uncharacterized protein n=1 Tax=Anaerovirgula multivorans TaxID=312168 RepID=A0A239LJP8_9FIRM|nr:hypothetical protein SAMN05446037_10812 [Anaerovirgula multivorans]